MKLSGRCCTVLGQYPNGDLFFIVVDGRRSNWSKGISLEEMQVTLMRLGVMEAFNLDGGGSSSFVFEGKVMNKPSDGKERPVATNIVILP
jgi:exopolysaccharide biosynthesis protein